LHYFGKEVCYHFSLIFLFSLQSV
jgi:hypothetical protein